MKLKPDMAINNGSIEIAKYLKNFYNLSKTVWESDIVDIICRKYKNQLKGSTILRL
jgi:hypothetical protein